MLYSHFNENLLGLQDVEIEKIEEINENEYKSIVNGSKKYEVCLNIEHVRKSKCNCPHADGKRIICKHIVATYFSVLPGSAKEFEEEQNRLQEEYEEYQEIKDLIEADKEFANGEGVHFSSLDELDDYLDD